MRLPPELERFMLEMQVQAHESQRKAVLADPAKHRLTLHFSTGAWMNWLYYPVKGKRGLRVRYCYSTGRNLAGYFLGWRETWDAKRGVGKRDMWIASKRRKTVADRAEARAKTHNQRVKGKPQRTLAERRTTYWIGEKGSGPAPGQTWSRGLGKVVTTGGPNNALDIARSKWPDAGEIYAVHIGRRERT